MRIALVFLIVALAVSVGINIYQSTKKPCFPNYHRLNIDASDQNPTFILLAHNDKTRDIDTPPDENNEKVSRGKKIPHKVGENMIFDYQGTIDVNDENNTVYVDYSLMTLYNYIGYVFQKAQNESKNPAKMRVRVFIANSNETSVSTGKKKHTTVFAVSNELDATGKKIWKLNDWDMYDEGSICPTCPQDPTGFGGISMQLYPGANKANQ